MKKFAASIVFYICISFSGTLSLPAGFVYLYNIDPTIQQDVMYYNTRNFIGQRIDGYKAPKIILTEKAALALKNIQDDMRKDNYSLLVHDAYRPTKAVAHFVRWGKDEKDQKMKKYYYPYISKRDAFRIGYVGEKSAHSRGSTIDLTIIELGKTYNSNPTAIKRTLKNGLTVYRWQDNTVDMYTSVDLADKASWHDTDLIDEQYTKNRNYLRQKMMEHGFEPYGIEWWHYTLIDEPFKDTYFNFDVE